MWIPKSIFKTITVEENGVRIDLNLKTGWGELVSILIDTACKLSGRQELSDKIKDILFAEEPCYKIVKTIGE